MLLYDYDSPRAFRYSSKLSLEIIFQYPFRSTGMVAVCLVPTSGY